MGACDVTQGQQDPAFRTKPQLALELMHAARAAGIPFRAVVADSLYGEHPEFTRTMWQADIPFVLAVKPSEVVWTVPPEPESPREAADRLLLGARARTRSIPAPGRRWCAASMTGMRTRGGPSICGWAGPTARIARTGWWWPPATHVPPGTSAIVPSGS